MHQPRLARRIKRFKVRVQKQYRHATGRLLTVRGFYVVVAGSQADAETRTARAISRLWSLGRGNHTSLSPQSPAIRWELGGQVLSARGWDYVFGSFKLEE